VDALPAVARSLTEEIADTLDCPPDFPGHAALVVAGASAGAAVALEIKPDWLEPACFFAVLVGLSGDGKTPTLKQVARPVFQAQEALNVAYQRDLLEFKAEHRAWVAGGRPGEEPRRPVRGRLHGSDLTTACIAPLLEQNPRGLLLIRDELSGWLQGMGESGDRARWLSLWSGADLTVDRRGQENPFMICRPFVSVMGGLVPGHLRSFTGSLRGARGVNAREDDDGLMPRCTFSYPPARRVGRFRSTSVRRETVQWWADVLLWLRKLPMRCEEGGTLHPDVVAFTEGGLEAFGAFYNRLSAEVNAAAFPDELRPAWMKLRSHAARLALTVHLLRRAEAATTSGVDPGKMVDAVSMEAAVRLALYFQAMFRRVACVATDGDATQRATAILRWLRQRRGKPLQQFKPWRLLPQLSRSLFHRVEDLTPALQLLVRLHYLRVVHPVQDESRRGRPEGLTYEVNPALYTDSNLVLPDEGDPRG
jgi:hypothetical protein